MDSIYWKCLDFKLKPNKMFTWNAFTNTLTSSCISIAYLAVLCDWKLLKGTPDKWNGFSPLKVIAWLLVLILCLIPAFPFIFISSSAPYAVYVIFGNMFPILIFLFLLLTVTKYPLYLCRSLAKFSKPPMDY